MESRLVLERMMKMSKILININNLNEIEEYKKIGITNFLFAVELFSIGYKTHTLSDIPYTAYLLINRVLDCEAVDEIKKLKDELLKYKGIIFEDLAIYNMFKDENIELIWYQNHFQTNYASINYYLNHGCTSAVISNEITESEILDIVASSSKPLVLTILAKNQIMYSRRHLLTNFNKHNNLENYNDMILEEKATSSHFRAKENEFGTIIYNDEYFNYVPLMQKVDDEKVKFYLILNQNLKIDEIKEILEGKPFGSSGFLNKKTVYRMSEYNDRKN